jgi:hypothetical protein
LAYNELVHAADEFAQPVRICVLRRGAAKGEPRRRRAFSARSLAISASSSRMRALSDAVVCRRFRRFQLRNAGFQLRNLSVPGGVLLGRVFRCRPAGFVAAAFVVRPARYRRDRSVLLLSVSLLQRYALQEGAAWIFASAAIC